MGDAASRALIKGSVQALPSGRFRARVTLADRTRKHLGVFDSKDAAASATHAATESIASGGDATDALIRNDPRFSSFVYFVQEMPPSGPIKIGRTRNIVSRLCGLRTGVPRELALLAVIPGGAALESAMHRAFAESQIKLEWYEPSTDLLALIEELRREWSRPGAIQVDLVKAPDGKRGPRG